MRRTLLIILAVAAPSVGAQTAEFIRLGHLPGPYPASSAVDISYRGSFIAGTSRSWVGNAGEAFRWDATQGMVGLGLLPGHNQSHAGAISPDGGWVVGHGVAEPEHWEAFAWSPGTGMFGLGDLPGGAHHSVARAVSHNGRVIVGNGTTYSTQWGQDVSEAFMWTERDGMVGLGTISPSDSRPSSTARDVSADGRIIVGSASSEQGTRAFRWTAESGMVGLDALDHERPASSAQAVSNNGLWTVGSSTSYLDDGTTGEQAVLWNPVGDLVPLGWPDGQVFRTVARDVTNDGSMVVGQAYGRAGDGGAFIWTPDDGMRVLSDVLRDDYNLDVRGMGWWLDEVSAISPDGLTLAGTGIGPEGFAEPWLIRLPTPSTLSLIPACALLAARRHR